MSRLDKTVAFSYTPYYIEGEFRDDRKDLFGRVRGVPAVKTKRVIEIHAVPA